MRDERPGRGSSPRGWSLAYGAPVLASGAATFTGYITLDDTASWMAVIDRVMSRGRSLQGLLPSSSTSTLAAYLPTGYPIGAFLGLGVAQQVMRTDVMWLYQPFLAYAARCSPSCSIS